ELRGLGWLHSDLPVDAVVLHPRRSFNDRTEIEKVRAGCCRRLDHELEPRDLIRADVISGLRRRTIVGGPSGARCKRTEAAAEIADLVAARIWIGGAEERHLAHPARNPPARPGVVVSDGCDRSLARAQRRVTGLAIPGRVESGDA